MNPGGQLSLSVVVVSYNTCAMTLECLRSVFRETQETSFELIVLDNASSDDSVEAIEHEFNGRVQLIASRDNIGFAAGNNRAAESARGEYLLLLNPDTVVLDGAIDTLIRFAKARSEAEIWGGRTVFGDGRLNPASCWSKQSLWSLTCQALGLSSFLKRSPIFNAEGIGGWDRNGHREVDIVSGCFLLIRRELWQTLGGFREVFFMYGEEADLCLRAAHLGARPVVTSEATIVHYGGASESIRCDKLVRLLKAKALLIESHIQHGKSLGYWLLAAWPISRYLVHALLSKLGWHSSIEKRSTWRAVVARRHEWMSSISSERK